MTRTDRKTLTLGVKVYAFFIPMACLWGGAYVHSLMAGTWLAFPWAVTVGLLMAVSLVIAVTVAVALVTEKTKAEREAIAELMKAFNPGGGKTGSGPKVPRR